MNVGAAVGNLGWLAASLPEYRRFTRAAGNPEATQRARLEHYLRQNADTAFGRYYDFTSIHSPGEYAGRVPVQDYDAFEPWIDRIANGEDRVLTADPVRLFEPTSGSSGPSKLVPYTASLQQEFRQVVAAWSSRNFLSQPGLLFGRAYWSLTPQMSLPERPGSAVPIGFDEDSAYLGGVAQKLINRTLVADPALRDLHDMDAFWRSTLLMLLRSADLRLISVWHPSYLVLLIERLREQWDSLLGDLDSMDPRRAGELRSAGCDDLQRIWPGLRLISCWADGHAAATAADLATLFPGVTIQPKGLIATEGVVTIPFGNRRPLAIRSHYFEFLDESGEARGAWQLEAGKTYSVVLTTGGGFYRYRLGDLVEVDGFYRGTPSLKFVGREGAVSDLRGEKISEEFAGQVIRDVLEAGHIASPFSMLAVDTDASPPAYVLYLETDSSFTPELAQQLERQLSANPHYELCVRLGQLDRARVERIGGNGFELYSQRLSEMGMRIGDIKPTPLSHHSGWSRFFAVSECV
jgi:hypothetical protein